MRVWGVRVFRVRYMSVFRHLGTAGLTNNTGACGPLIVMHSTPPPCWGPWLLPSSVYCIRTTDTADAGHQGHQNLTSSDPHYPLSTVTLSVATFICPSDCNYHKSSSQLLPTENVGGSTGSREHGGGGEKMELARVIRSQNL